MPKMAGSDWVSAIFHHIICYSIIRNHFQPKKSDFEKDLFCPPYLASYLTVQGRESITTKLDLVCAILASLSFNGHKEKCLKTFESRESF